jgi:hypothetical protein
MVVVMGARHMLATRQLPAPVDDARFSTSISVSPPTSPSGSSQ